MKQSLNKFLIPLLSLFLSFPAFPFQLSPEEALARFQAIGSIPSRSNLQTQLPQLVATLSNEKSKPCIYVFERDAECFLTSADSDAEPLLGYFDKTNDGFNLNELPPQLRWLLDGYISYVSNVTHASRSGINDALMSEIRSGWTPITPILKTAWNQDFPYNSALPTIGIERCLTGCMATAMAQIMTYYQYPERGRGNIEYITASQEMSLSMSFDSPFDWETITSISEKPQTAKEIDAVGFLMKACGYAIESDYGLGETLASDYDAKKAFVEYFDYDNGVEVFDNYNFTQKEWESILYKNLSEVGPVIYSGGWSYRHAFICDGYDRDGLFHINWGWGGTGDGYFHLLALKPDATTDHTLYASMILGIKPNDGKSNPVSDIICASSCTPYVIDDMLYVDYCWANEYRNDIKPIICMTSSDGKSWYIENHSIENISPFFMTTLCRDADIPNGEYYITFGANDKEGIFKEFYGANLSTYRCIVKVEDGKYTGLTSNFNRLTLKNVDYPQEVTEGYSYLVSAEIANTTREYISRNIYISLVCEEAQQSWGLNPIKVNLEPEQSETISFEFSVPTINTTLQGAEQISLEIIDGGNIMDKPIQLVLHRNPLPSIISAEIPKVFNNLQDVVNITIEGPYHGTPSFRVRKKETLDWVGVILNNKETFDLAAGQRATVTATGGIGKLGTTNMLESGEYILDFFDTDRDLSIQMYPIMVDDLSRKIVSIGIYTNLMTISNLWELRSVVRNNTGMTLENIIFQPSVVIGNNQYIFDRGDLNFGTFTLKPYEEVSLYANVKVTGATPGKQMVNVELFGDFFSFTKTVDVNVFNPTQLPATDLTPAMECLEISSKYDGDSINCNLTAKLVTGVLNNPVRFRLIAYDENEEVIVDCYSDWIVQEKLFLTAGDIGVFSPYFKAPENATSINRWEIQCLSHNSNTFGSSSERVMFTQELMQSHSGLDKITNRSDIPTIRILTGAIIISNVRKGVTLTLHDITGMILINKISDGNEVTIPTHPGIYILNAGDSSVKILAK